MSWSTWGQVKDVPQAGSQGRWVTQVIEVLSSEEVGVGPVEMGNEKESRESASHERKGVGCNDIQHQTLPDTLISQDILDSPKCLFGRMYVELHVVHVGVCAGRAVQKSYLSIFLKLC